MVLDDDDEWEDLDLPDDPLLQTSPPVIARSTADTTTGSSSWSTICDAVPAQSQAEAEKESAQTTTTTAAASYAAYAERRKQEMEDRLSSRIARNSLLFDQPIRLLVVRLLYHWMWTVWEINWQTRWAAILIMTGTTINISMAMHWYFWHPRILLGVVLLVAPILLLQPDANSLVAAMVRGISNQFSLAPPTVSPGTILESLEGTVWLSNNLRKLALAGILLPTLLEMRALHWLVLAHIETETSWITMALFSFALTALFVFLCQNHHHPPRQCTYLAWLAAYASALLVNVLHFELRRLPVLIGPTCIVTGVLLWNWKQQQQQQQSIANNDGHNDWLAQSLHDALRLALRDVVAQFGEQQQNADQDKALQLLMARWIADYWSHRKATTVSTPTPPPTQAMSTATLKSRNSESNGVPQQQKTSAPELQWTDLYPMLDSTSTQMTNECVQLRSSSTNPNDPSFQPTTPNRQSGNPFHDLKTMLANIDIDERAKPAFLAYKALVQRVPPTQLGAVYVSLIRRCPAILTWFYHLFFSNGDLVMYTLCLVPFMVLEGMRLHLSVESCAQASASLPALDDDNESFYLVQFQNLDAMVILLSPDVVSLDQPPALLSVWENIRESVNALEMGLTTTRCLQTTAVAFDFASNIVSLTHLGLEVSTHGWKHGVSLLLQDVLQFREGKSSHYSHAASSAWRNSQILSNNVQSLASEGKTNDVFHLVVNSMMLGCGWIWGQKNDFPQNKSGVVIEELHDCDTLANGTSSHHEKSIDATLEKEIETKQAQDESLPPTYDFMTTARGSGMPNDNSKSASIDSRLVTKSIEDNDLDNRNEARICRLVELLAQCRAQGVLDESEMSLMEKQSSAKPVDAELILGSIRTLELLLLDAETTRNNSTTNDTYCCLSSSITESVSDAAKPESLSRENSDDRYEPITDIVTTTQTSNDPPCKEEPNSTKEDQNNVWITMAVVGAAVGGIALALNNNGGGTEEERKKKRSNDERST